MKCSIKFLYATSKNRNYMNGLKKMLFYIRLRNKNINT